MPTWWPANSSVVCHYFNNKQRYKSTIRFLSLLSRLTHIPRFSALTSKCRSDFSSSDLTRSFNAMSIGVLSSWSAQRASAPFFSSRAIHSTLNTRPSAKQWLDTVVQCHVHWSVVIVVSTASISTVLQQQSYTFYAQHTTICQTVLTGTVNKMNVVKLPLCQCSGSTTDIMKTIILTLQRSRLKPYGQPVYIVLLAYVICNHYYTQLCCY